MHLYTYTYNLYKFIQTYMMQMYGKSSSIFSLTGGKCLTNILFYCLGIYANLVFLANEIRPPSIIIEKLSFIFMKK